MAAQFSVIPARAVLDRRLPRGALLVLAAIGLHTNVHGWAWPSQGRLGELTGMSRQMVGRYMYLLEKLAYIDRRQRARDDGGRTSDEVRIIFDSTGAHDYEFSHDEVAPPATLEVAPPAILEVAPPAISEVALTNQKKEPKERTKRIKEPEWVPLEEWQHFKDMRKKIRAPMTDEAAKRIIKELESLRAQGNDVKEVLMQSVANSWRGVFPLKKKSSVHDINAQALAEFNRRRSNG